MIRSSKIQWCHSIEGEGPGQQRSVLEVGHDLFGEEFDAPRGLGEAHVSPGQVREQVAGTGDSLLLLDHPGNRVGTSHDAVALADEALAVDRLHAGAANVLAAFV